MKRSSIFIIPQAPWSKQIVGEPSVQQSLLRGQTTDPDNTIVLRTHEISQPISPSVCGLR